MLSSHTDVHRVLPCLVGLPNEKSVVSDREGSIVKVKYSTMTFIEGLE